MVLAMEMMGKEVAGLYILFLNLWWPVGSVITIGVSWYIRAYENLILATVVPYGFLCLGLLFLPESPRWLLASHR